MSSEIIFLLKILTSFFFTDFDAIFQTLDKVQGSHDVKRVFAQDLITHAEKFRKKQLVESLREWAGSSSKTTPVEKSRNKLKS